MQLKGEIKMHPPSVYKSHIPSMISPRVTVKPLPLDISRMDAAEAKQLVDVSSDPLADSCTVFYKADRGMIGETSVFTVLHILSEPTQNGMERRLRVSSGASANPRGLLGQEA